MVKKRLFRLELFCPSLPVILDEIPQLIFLCIIPLPVVISKLTGMYSLPCWFLWVALLGGAYFWLSATLKFVRSVSKCKFRLTDSIAICLFLLLIPCALFSKAFNSPILGEGKAMPGDIVVVRIEPYIATEKVISVTERFDDKLGTYSCYRIDFGELDNGEHDIQTIPFQFMEKIQSSKASP